MKKNLIGSLIFSLLVLIAASSYSQSKAKYIPEKGYWQLVSNIHDKKRVTVKFYSEQNELIYEETLANTKMNPGRKKVRRQLYDAFQDAYHQWAFNKQVSSTDLIAKRK